MDSQKSFLARNRFIRNVLFLDSGIIVISAILHASLHFNFGVTLFVLGLLVGGLGAYLGAPDRLDWKRPRNQWFKYLNHPVKQAWEQAVYNAEHTVPKYAFENALLIGGFLAIVIGFIIWWRS